jgi:hypothetical protein
MKRRKPAPQFRAMLATYKGMMAVNDAEDNLRAYLMRFDAGNPRITIDVVLDRHNATELVETLSEALREDSEGG